MHQQTTPPRRAARALAVTALAGFAALSAGARAAWADIKVVATETVKGIPPMMGGIMGGVPGDKGKQAGPAPVSTVTTYYKGNRQRTERGSDITVSDFDAGKLYTLNAAKKTYTETSLTDAMKGVNSEMLQMFKVDATADVKPGGQTRTIADRPASNYRYTLVIKMEATNPQMAALLNGISTTVEGEQWVTTSLAMPTDPSRLLQGNFVKQLPIDSKSVEQVAAKMATMKGFPLSSTTTVRVQLPPQLLAMMTAQTGEEAKNEPMVITTEVTSISEDPLADALFAVPSDYKKVDAPRPAAGLPGAPQ